MRTQILITWQGKRVRGKSKLARAASRSRERGAALWTHTRSLSATTMSTVAKLRRNPPNHSWETWGKTGSSSSSSHEPRNSRTLSYALESPSNHSSSSYRSSALTSIPQNTALGKPNELRTSYQDFSAPPLPQSRREQYWAYRAFTAEQKLAELERNEDTCRVSAPV